MSELDEILDVKPKYLRVQLKDGSGNPLYPQTLPDFELVERVDRLEYLIKDLREQIDVLNKQIDIITES